MSRTVALHICLTFCSLLFLNFVVQCLAFPKVERREVTPSYAEEGQSEKMGTGDQENSPVTPEYTPQQMFSEEPMVLSAGAPVAPSSKVLSINGENQVGSLKPESPGLLSAAQAAVPASEDKHGSIHLERASLEPRLSMLTMATTAMASLSPDQEQPFSSSSMQPAVEGITEAAQGLLKSVDKQLFATESQEGDSLGHSSSSYTNTEETLTANPRTETIDKDAVQKKTSFPEVPSTADTESYEEMTLDNTQLPATKHLPAISDYALSVEPETDHLLGVPGAPLSVSTTVPVGSVLSDEWDDTKLESVSQIRPPGQGDTTELQESLEASQTTRASLAVTDEDPPSAEATELAPDSPDQETQPGNSMPVAKGDERSSVFTHQSSPTPSRPMEDSEAPVVDLFPNIGGPMASTEEDGIRFFSETTVSISEYESEVYQPLGNVLKDITEKMTTDTHELEATLPLVTQELGSVFTTEVPRGSGEPEEDRTSQSPVSDVAAVTQSSGMWEPLATPASTTAGPLSFEVTPALEDPVDTVTGPDEEFDPVLGSPVTATGVTAEPPTISPALPSEERTVLSVSFPTTAASYGLEQFESEEGDEDEDEEDEEDEDEEEEEEEEDEDDKDADSLDENFNSDTELPGFTLPGVTSQEPGIDPGNMDLLEGATYQVPDAIEWEQQNQGLVRSWMEKLKDKAGYMSGMLVPVGVGIAGALFILGALYSIKVMNRRRRSGFKRHKRKQREFNSMQDRVMLLADSSEDEF